MSDVALAILTREPVRVITLAISTTHVFQILDGVLFGALKKHATGLRTLDEEQPTAAFIIKVYQDFKQMMMEVNIWGVFIHRDHSLMTLTKIFMDCSSTRKSSDKVRASSNSESAMCD
jgi:hypothetical protein